MPLDSAAERRTLRLMLLSTEPKDRPRAPPDPVPTARDGAHPVVDAVAAAAVAAGHRPDVVAAFATAVLPRSRCVCKGI